MIDAPPSSPDLQGALSQISGSGTGALQNLQQDQAKLEGADKDLANIPGFDPAKEEQGAPQINRNGVMATMPWLIGLTALGGKVAGIHPKVMLNSVNGMTKGLIQGNEKFYQDAKAKYDDAYQKYMDKYKQQMQIYKEMQQVYKGQVNADMKALEISLRATGYQGKVDEEALKAWQWTQDHTAKLETANETMRHHMATEDATRASAAAKVTAAEKKTGVTAKTIDEADTQIDSIIKQLQDHPSSAGLVGYGKRFVETIGSATGMTDEAPAHELQTSMEALLLQLPKLLTGTSKSSKDERERVNKIADSLQIGVTAPIAIQKLQQLKTILADKRGEASANPNDKFVVGQSYTDAKGRKAVYKGNGQWQTQ